MYYRHTADKGFFVENPALKEIFEQLLTTVLDSREEEDVYLFPSSFISDGYAMFDRHTGSNICAWFAFHSCSRLMEEVYGDNALAVRYLKIADKIKLDIRKHCTGEGPMGFQYNEGFQKDGTAPFWLHDGEDTDVTLAPFYGMAPFDDEPYTNFAKFAMSEENPPYCKATRGIVWERYPEGWQTVGPRMGDATSPGYITALAGSDTPEWLHERLEVLKGVYDLNGALPWWPYLPGASYGEVVRQYSGMHCTWAMSSFVCLYISAFLGINYDAPTKKLSIRHSWLSPTYSYAPLYIGNAVFEIEKGEKSVSVCNRSSFSVQVSIEFASNKDRTSFCEKILQPEHSSIIKIAQD